jgi:hypothetical protein
MRRKLIGFNLVVLFSLATAASGQVKVKVEDHSLGETAAKELSRSRTVALCTQDRALQESR